MALQLTTVSVIRGAAPAKKAIQMSWLFRGLLPEPPLFPYSSIDWTTVFCIVPPGRRGGGRLACSEFVKSFLNHPPFKHRLSIHTRLQKK